jgi:pimeloyl-ACP methyl ester carboxylesterase
MWMPDNAARLRRHRRTIDGVTTTVLEAGPPDATEALVAVHGNPGSAEELAGIVGTAGRHLRAVAVDMPGFGRSERPADFPYTVEGYARHLGAVLDALDIDRAHLLLHDFGGAWGLRWAVDHPGRTRSVVLMNAAGMPGYRWHGLARLWRTPWLGELLMAGTTRAAFMLLLRHGNPTPIPPGHLRRMFEQFDEGTRRAVLRLYRATHPDDYAWLEPLLRSQALPALVLWGEADPYLSLVDAQRFSRVFPSARFVRIRGHGHWPHLTAPDTVAEVLDRWAADRLATRA